MTPDAPMPHDWLSIGQTVGLFIIGIITAWSKVNQNKTAKTVEATAETVKQVASVAAETSAKVEQTVAQAVTTAQTVDKIHILTNGSMTSQKNTIARVTAALAAITKDPSDQRIAADAMKDFMEHLEAQSNANKESKSTDQTL